MSPSSPSNSIPNAFFAADTAFKEVETGDVAFRDAIAKLDAKIAESANVQTPMPQYQCHKKVWALKILNVVDPTIPGNETDGSRIIIPQDERFAPFKVDNAYVQKHKPEAGGYYVVYADGYKSYSPANAFEEGYARL